MEKIQTKINGYTWLQDEPTLINADIVGKYNKDDIAALEDWAHDWLETDNDAPKKIRVTIGAGNYREDRIEIMPQGSRSYTQTEYIYV